MNQANAKLLLAVDFSASMVSLSNLICRAGMNNDQHEPSENMLVIVEKCAS